MVKGEVSWLGGKGGRGRPLFCRMPLFSPPFNGMNGEIIFQKEGVTSSAQQSRPPFILCVAAVLFTGCPIILIRLAVNLYLSIWARIMGQAVCICAGAAKFLCFAAQKSRIIRESAKNNCMEVKRVRVHVKLILKSIHLDIVRVFKKRKEEKFLPKQNN